MSDSIQIGEQWLSCRAQEGTKVSDLNVLWPKILNTQTKKNETWGQENCSAPQIFFLFIFYFFGFDWPVWLYNDIDLNIKELWSINFKESEVDNKNQLWWKCSKKSFVDFLQSLLYLRLINVSDLVC